MARCEVCGKQMRSPTVTTCSRDKRRELGPMVFEGVEYQPVPFDVNGPLERCPDCSVLKGGIHHFGCDQDKCPVCGGQFISCGCFDEAYDHLADPED
jgi:hypothetical protein